MAISFAGFVNNENSMIVAWRFRTQDSKRKVYMKMQFQKRYIESKYVSAVVLLQIVYLTQKLALFSIGDFHKIFLVVKCCTLGRFEIWTLTPNRLKYQASDTFKLLYHKWNHQQGFVTQKIVALHCFGFNLKFPKHLLWQLFWVNIDEIVVIGDYNNVESDDHMSTVVLFLSFYFRLKSVISMGFFNRNSLIVARRYRIQDIYKIQKEKYACAIFLKKQLILKNQSMHLQ